MIGNTKYYLGGYNNSLRIKKDVMYQYERKISGSDYYNGSNPNSWVGKLALMYASDYGYAVSDECTQNLIGYVDATCKNNNWLFKGNNEWMLPQEAIGINHVFIVCSDGHVDNYGVNSNMFAVRPVLYLISSAQITGGNGTIGSPYKLSI